MTHTARYGTAANLSLQLIKAYLLKYESHFNSTGIVLWKLIAVSYLITANKSHLFWTTSQRVCRADFHWMKATQWHLFLSFLLNKLHVLKRNQQWWVALLEQFVGLQLHSSNFRCQVPKPLSLALWKKFNSWNQRAWLQNNLKWWLR
jgi:hypothetical protein